MRSMGRLGSFAFALVAACVVQAQDKAEVTAPTQHCVDRLIEPIAGLAAQLRPPRTSVKPDDVDPEWLQHVAAAVAELKSSLGAARGAVSVRALIATVPDPIDSGLVYQFETMMQALRLGFEQPRADTSSVGHAYYGDRSFLPWLSHERGDDDRARSEACRHQLPGVVLFRNDDLFLTELVLLFVVGESPTSGVHGAAFHHALRLAASLSTPSADPKAPLRIIGPAFSGSAYSLRLLLEAFAREPEAPQVFRLISGTASGTEVPRLLDSAVAHQSAASGGPQLTFQATTVSEAAADCAYLWFLHSRLGVPTRGGDAALKSGVPSRAPLLEGVATLRESGTAFGASSLGPLDDQARCGLRAELTLSFPVYVSKLRDAYETMEGEADEREEPGDKPDAIVRRTALGPRLREERLGHVAEPELSQKTRAAMDVMLSQVLSQISRHGVTHVSIHATDVGDALFLARKIRDVAPDVRIAFFEPDDILLHPKYRADLLGSLVVSPYPFLGVNDFAPFRRDEHVYQGFPNALSQGLFNAVLAQRDIPAKELFDYATRDQLSPTAPLLVWISTIARTGIVAMDVKPPLDCTESIYRNGLMLDMAPARALCSGATSGPARQEAWKAYNAVRRTSFPLDAALDLPRLWNFMYMAFAFAFVADWARQRSSARRLAHDRFPRRFDDGDDRAADRAIGRTKWWLYATIRRFVFVLAFAYMDIVYWFSFVAANGLAPSALWTHVSDVIISAFVVLVLGASIVCCLSAAGRFFRDYARFATYVGGKGYVWKLGALLEGLGQGRISSESLPPQAAEERGPWWDRLSLSLGFAEPVDRERAARVSFAQLGLVVAFTCVMAAIFTALLFASAFATADGSWWPQHSPGPVLTLNVIRDVPLLNGVSPAAPALACMLSVYVWATGRMSRLWHAHALSRLAPPDGEADLVSTPIRYVLYPGSGASRDEGYTLAERDLLNAIWRPITGRNYVFACLAIIFFPCVLFWLKPLHTLETTSGKWLLGTGLALSAALIGVTMIQLIQFWLRLERLLMRTLAHELAPAFKRLPALVRSTLEEQLSRSSGCLLRWVGCARELDRLVVQLPDPAAVSGELTQLSELQQHAEQLRGRTERALRMADAPKSTAGPMPVPQDLEETELAEAVLVAAARVSRLLAERRVRARPMWRERAERTAVAVGQEHGFSALEVARSSDSGTMRVEASTPAAAPQDSDWITQAETFVATVATVLIQQHVRQFRHFMSTLVTSALLLLIGVTSYPFQPYRLLLTCIWVIVGSVVATGLWVYLQLNANPLIRSMAPTRKRSPLLSPGFVLRVMAWAVIPLLSVAAAQYPDLANVLFQIVMPFTRALK